jgi:hypothetical protein
MVAKYIPEVLKQISFSDAVLIRKAIVNYKDWMPPEQILMLIDLGKRIFKLDETRKIELTQK